MVRFLSFRLGHHFTMVWFVWQKLGTSAFKKIVNAGTRCTVSLFRVQLCLNQLVSIFARVIPCQTFFCRRKFCWASISRAVLVCMDPYLWATTSLEPDIMGKKKYGHGWVRLILKLVCFFSQILLIQSWRSSKNTTILNKAYGIQVKSCRIKPCWMIFVSQIAICRVTKTLSLFLACNDWSFAVLLRKMYQVPEEIGVKEPKPSHYRHKNSTSSEARHEVRIAFNQCNFELPLITVKARAYKTFAISVQWPVLCFLLCKSNSKKFLWYANTSRAHRKFF